MKKWIFKVEILFVISFFPLVAFAADGDLLWEFDPVPGTFANPVGARANGVTLGSGAYDGVYIAGNDDIGGDSNDWRVDKYSKAGTLQWKHERNIFPGYDDIPQDITVISEGANAGIYVAGGCHIAGGHPGFWCVEKLDHDGNIIWTKEESVGGRESYATSIAAGSDGLYVAGSRGTEWGSQWRIEKRDFDLNLVSSFGEGGVILVDTFQRMAYDVAVDSSMLYVIGKMEGGGGKWRIEERNLITGELIRSDDSNLSGGNDRALGVAVSGNSLYVVGSEAVLETGGAWVIEKRNISDLSRDFSFGAAGRIEDNPTAGDDTPYAAVVNSPYLYVAGEYNERWRIQKRDISTGNLVETYGTDLDNHSRVAMDILLEGGSLYASGSRGMGWRLEKRELGVPPSVLKICESSCASGVLLPASITMEKNTSKNLRACYGTTLDCDDVNPSADVTSQASWSEEEGNNAVSLSDSGPDKKVKAEEAGVENISASWNSSMKNISISVYENCFCSATPECENTCISSRCRNSCGNNVCSGTKICLKSGNWKEVAP